MSGRARIFRKLHDKLRDTRGETITETLAAVLIAAMAMIIFASMITASQRIITKSEAVMKDYYAGVSSMETAGTAAGTGTVTIKQKGQEMVYGISSKGQGTGISVNYAVSSTDSSGRIQAAEYWLPN